MHRSCLSVLAAARAALLALLVLAAGPAAAEVKLSLAGAVRVALAQNPSLRLEQAKKEEAEATRKSTRGLYGPRLMLEGNVMVWDSELPFEFDIPDASSVDITNPTSIEEFKKKYGFTDADLLTLAKYSDLLGIFGSLLDLGNIRDQVTGQLQVSLAQPLTPLLQIHAGYKATRHLARAADLDLAVKRVEVANRVAETYLQVLQTRRFVEVARTGVEQVEAHLTQARRYQVAGLIGRQDVLKADLELARAKERLIRARYGLRLVSSALALQLGLPLSERFVLSEQVTDPPPTLGLSQAECEKRALRARADLSALKLRGQAAEAGQERARWDMLPQISAVATYQHTEGQGTFSPPNAFFAGGVLKWEMWDWGSKYYAAQAAGAKVRQAELGLRLLREGIQIQVQKAYLDLQQASEALEVARVAITEAKENFRIEKQRFAANANTSTDVLDAQLALTRAELSYTTSLYSYYIAMAALRTAMGELPTNAR